MEEQVTQASVQRQVNEALAKERAKNMARGALIAAIVGILFFGIVLGPYAISRARKAKAMLSPGEEGRGNADAAEIIGWIALVVWALGCIINLALVTSQ